MEITNPLEELSADELLAMVDRDRLPRHIAVIMDGNGRWAKERKFPRIRGHRAGIKAVRGCITTCRELGVPYLTLYAFSMENWKRPEREIKGLMKLLKEYLIGEREEMLEKGIRLRAIGRLDYLPEDVRAVLDETRDATAKGTEMTLTLALSYGGRAEIVDAVKSLRVGNLEDIGEEDISEHMYAPDHPDPDLLVRTSGEMRISNFLLWEIAYAEIYVTNVYWPDFDAKHVYAAIVDYQRRERRFGGVTPAVGARG
ncbi:MAG: isoprenyl transferase [Candidatus Coatesbacteria bacterium]|nr:MAG: isoprenyl transferase [Candidatus Coatesbacteria bacterium]